MTQVPTHTLKGQCLCGAVQYAATAPFINAEACHCTQCARWTGSYFASTTVQRSDLIVTSGDSLKWFHSSETGRRGFCAKCGSSLFWERVNGDEVDIMIGSLDQPTGLTIREHIFVAHKSDYYDISDGVLQYPGSRATE